MNARTLNVLLALALAVASSGCSSPVVSSVESGIRSLMSSTALAEEIAFGVTAPAGTVEASIQDVILRANQQQEQAIASRDQSVMRETATESHYQDLVEINERMLGSGVTAIRLANLEWGEISVSGQVATATTWETWITTLTRGRTDESRDRNVYVLVQQDGVWKIQTNEHPADLLPSPGESIEAPTPVPEVPAFPSATARGRSSNWSGYAAVGGSFSGVTGTWTVPEPTPDGNTGVSATWVGIGGERSRDLIQAGTEETVFSSGRIRYTAWFETLPQVSRPVPLPVHAGDSLTVSINQQDTGMWAINFVNHTTGGTHDRTVQYNSSRSSAEWIVEAPSMGGRGGLLPLSNFGTVTFTDGSAVRDGQSVSLGQAGALPITMINRLEQALATPSALDASGAGFTIKREAAAPTTGRRSRS